MWYNNLYIKAVHSLSQPLVAAKSQVHGLKLMLFWAINLHVCVYVYACAHAYESHRSTLSVNFQVTVYAVFSFLNKF